ncbi:hypothetical protein ABFS83_09G116000 [Erythranthe nasuta]
MESGAKGCELIARGKLRAQPSASQIHEIRRRGVLGIEFKIMLDWDPKGKKQGLITPSPDLVTIYPPKEEEHYIGPPVAAATDVDIEAVVAKKFSKLMTES